MPGCLTLNLARPCYERTRFFEVVASHFVAKAFNFRNRCTPKAPGVIKLILSLQPRFF
jgi:hypothetical protein